MTSIQGGVGSPLSQIMLGYDTQAMELSMSTSTNNTIQDKTSQITKNLTYRDTDIGPYIVVIQATGNEKHIGNYHPMAIGEMLLTTKVEGISKIKRQGINKVAIEFKTPQHANNFLNNKEIMDKGYEMFIPTNMVTCKGIARGIFPGLSEEKIIKHVKSKREVIGVRRFNRRNVNASGKVEYIPTSTIMLTFRGKIMPRFVEILYNDVEIHTYISPVVMCMKCLRFGHTKKQCRSKNERCAKCAEQHLTENCDTLEVKCYHCNDNHMATDKACKEQQRQKRIKEIMVFENISFFEAKKKVGDQHFSRKLGDFPALRQTVDNTKEEIDVQQRENNIEKREVKNFSFTQIVKRRRTSPEVPGYDHDAHKALLIGSYSSPGTSKPKYTNNTKEHKEYIEDLVQYINKDNITKDDKAVMLTLLTEIIKNKNQEIITTDTQTITKRLPTQKCNLIDSTPAQY